MPSGAGPSSGLKRRKLDDAEDNTNGDSKKQRSRVSFSCGECHRRKQKCDRKVPCSHCVARKVPELCKAYTPGKGDDISVRLARLEQIIEIALPQFFTDGDRRSSSHGLDDDHSPHEEGDPSGGTFQSGKWYGNSGSASVVSGTILEQLQRAVVPGQSSPRMRDPSSPDVVNGAPMLDGIIIDPTEPSAAENLKGLVQECGVSPHKISELLQELPPRRFSDVLVDYYFESINWTRYPVSEHDFRAAYTSLCAHGVVADPSDARFLPLLFVILAIAVRLAPEHIAGDARSRRLTSLRYYWSSRRSLLIAVAIAPESLDIVLTRLMSARFLTYDRKMTECWSQLGAAVRTAQALGLHRDGSTIRGMDPAQVEYRRRIWSYLYHADRSYALVVGRPTAIQDDYTSTLAPLNIDDSLATPPTPLTVPTPMTFVILRHALAGIIGRMVHHFQQVRQPSHYADVLVLDEELLQFANTLPPHFSFDPDTSLDVTSKFIPGHRFLLITEILFIRISLHRPYLLRRLGSDRYARSRAACFESAIKDFEVRRAFRATMPQSLRDSLIIAYREFQTAMVSGIYLVLEPHGEYSVAMHAILDGFMADHEGVHEIDVTTRRELKTIEFLKKKAQAVSIEDHLHGAPSDLPMDAHLLLGLQRSASKTPKNQLPPLHQQMGGPSSPAIHRLQQTGDAEPSPINSGSPSTDDESQAQSLLDHWCNTIGTAGVDGNAFGGSEFSIWGGNSGSPTPNLETSGSDWNYWETLVSQIQPYRGP